MPSPQKVSWSKLRVGVTALVALAIIGTLIFMLTTSGNIFKSKLTLRMFMDDASGTSESAPVRLNGIPIGNIKKIALSGDKNPARAVEFTLEVRGEFQKDIPEDSVAQISASNLLGDKFVNITRGRSPKVVQNGGEICLGHVVCKRVIAEDADGVACGCELLAPAHDTFGQGLDLLERDLLG